MIRYLALASAIVMAAIALLLVLARHGSPPDAIASSTLASPGPPRNEGVPSGSAAPLTGDAPWALSALPECFRQTHAIHGSQRYVAAHLAGLAPARTRWKRARTGHLTTADCVVTLAGNVALVKRGDTRLVVPADARFSIAGDRVILDRFAGGVEDVRVYVLRDGKAPAFDN